MVEELNFDEIIDAFTDKNTLKRASSISNDSLKILKLDKERGLIEAQVQGNKLVPYKLNFSISQENLYDVITHDCPDYLGRKKANNKFCKHIAKLFFVLRNQDSNFCINIMNKYYNRIQKEVQPNEINLIDFNHFINKGIDSQLSFIYKGFDFFFDLIELNKSTRSCLKQILLEGKRLPAALGGFHGAYKGGLFDHILLVTNYAFILCNSNEFQVDVKKAVLTAIYHDFGKISYYSLRNKKVESKVKVYREELEEAHKEIVRKFNYKGRDKHVEEALAVLNKYKEVLFYDDEMCKAIIFHHGRWSKYYPIDMNELAVLVHKADMIASHTHFI